LNRAAASRLARTEVQMSSFDVASGSTAGDGPVLSGEMKLEAVILPVADVDRAKDFYEGLGWRLDADFSAGEEFRLVQLTPPGSACSIHFGKNLTSAEPGCIGDLHLAVADIDAAREELAARGVEVSEVYHCTEGIACRYREIGDLLPGAGLDGRDSGRDPEGRSYSSFASFSDPDGNGWVLQEITSRLPGR
jgi:catechol 2,3-dioxygenase-like lactoylglutathione lyase family enzyme